MMRFSKNLLLVLGALATIAFIGLMIYTVIEVNQLHAVAVANRSAGFDNPRNLMLIGAAIGLGAGILLGMGIAMPSKSFKQRYAEARSGEAGQAIGKNAATDSHMADPNGNPSMQQFNPEQGV